MTAKCQPSEHNTPALRGEQNVQPHALRELRAPEPPPGSGVWRHFFLLLPVLFCFLALRAFGIAPHLANIAPAGGQRGSEVEIAFEGERLQDAEEILSYEPGVEVVKLLSVSNKIVRAQVKLLQDSPLGEHHLRLRTTTGLSDIRTFFVGPFPVVEEVEPNKHPLCEPICGKACVSG